MDPLVMILVIMIVVLLTFFPIFLIRAFAPQIRNFLHKHFRISVEKDRKAVAMFVGLGEDLDIMYITRAENPRTAIEVLRDHRIVVPDDTKITFIRLRISRTTIEAKTLGEIRENLDVKGQQIIKITNGELKDLISAYPDVFPNESTS